MILCLSSSPIPAMMPLVDTPTNTPWWTMDSKFTHPWCFNLWILKPVLGSPFEPYYVTMEKWDECVKWNLPEISERMKLRIIEFTCITELRNINLVTDKWLNKLIIYIIPRTTLTLTSTQWSWFKDKNWFLCRRDSREYIFFLILWTIHCDERLSRGPKPVTVLELVTDIDWMTDVSKTTVFPLLKVPFWCKKKILIT